jgi:hypothetical protein
VTSTPTAPQDQARGLTGSWLASRVSGLVSRLLPSRETAFLIQRPGGGRSKRRRNIRGYPGRRAERVRIELTNRINDRCLSRTVPPPTGPTSPACPPGREPRRPASQGPDALCAEARERVPPGEAAAPPSSNRPRGLTEGCSARPAQPGQAARCGARTPGGCHAGLRRSFAASRVGVRGPDRHRTGYLQSAELALYQVSYRPVRDYARGASLVHFPRNCALNRQPGQPDASRAIHRGEGRTRTGNRLLAKQVLYQLSYVPSVRRLRCTALRLIYISMLLARTVSSSW